MKKIFILIGVIIIPILSIIVYKNRSIPRITDISHVEVHIGGKGQEEDTRLKFTNLDNIKELRKIHSKLNYYKDPKVCTWFLDVELQYVLNSGRVKKFMFKDIRPVSDYFDNIYNSLEYRKQSNPIYNLSVEDITSVRIKDSYTDRKKEFIVTDREIIKELLDKSIVANREYDNNKEYYTIATVEFFRRDESIAQSRIRREQDIWSEILELDPSLADIYVHVNEVKEVLLTKDDSDEQIVVSDGDVIRIILDNYFGFHSNSSSQYSVEIVMKDENMRHWYGSFLKDQVPTEIINLFKE